jgi:hypothetical protein
VRTHDVLDTTGGTTSTTVHLGQALRATDRRTLSPAAVSTGTLDGFLASIQVGDLETLVAYRDDVGCPS